MSLCGIVTHPYRRRHGRSWTKRIVRSATNPSDLVLTEMGLTALALPQMDQRPAQSSPYLIDFTCASNGPVIARVLVRRHT